MIDYKWDKRFMEMARLVGSWSSCYKMNRQVGTVIVKNKRILTTGDKGYCIRIQNNIESGSRLEFCYSVHSEQNAICQAAKMGISVEGATLYCTHQPCAVCARLIINAGIKRVVYEDDYNDDFSLKLFEEAGILVERYKSQT